jgi:hypothetical protein
MNRLTLVSFSGEINSSETNLPDINGGLGKMTLTMDAIDEGEVYEWLVIINLPKLKPRVAVASETRDAKAGS